MNKIVPLVVFSFYSIYMVAEAQLLLNISKFLSLSAPLGLVSDSQDLDNHT